MPNTEENRSTVTLKSASKVHKVLLQFFFMKYEKCVISINLQSIRILLYKRSTEKQEEFYSHFHGIYKPDQFYSSYH